ncbi:hypothetical protein AALP_AA3G146300 [Arabis alpina]|uniref:Uncharacterized protein n=1 Tax=Arabis alpina TaxID=50452 RepID=A0A087H975_ARAAL|nr:hypothetical protein AALP_AA3G146300 [Arabis alpina]
MSLKNLGSIIARRLVGTVIPSVSPLESKGKKDIPARFVVATAFSAVGYGVGYVIFCVYDAAERTVKNMMGRER